MGNRSTEKLVAALREARAPAALVARAEAGEFHDFDSQSATPIIDLVNICRTYGLHSIVSRAISGEFDATREESEAWARSPEGQETIRQLSGEGPDAD